jgi:hypothetical protein
MEDNNLRNYLRQEQEALIRQKEAQLKREQDLERQADLARL